MAKKNVTARIEGTAIDALRQGSETDPQVVVRVFHTAAKPTMVGAERAKEKALVDFDALEAAEVAARSAQSAANAIAESKADAAVATKLGV